MNKKDIIGEALYNNKLSNIYIWLPKNLNNKFEILLASLIDDNLTCFEKVENKKTTEVFLITRIIYNYINNFFLLIKTVLTSSELNFFQ